MGSWSRIHRSIETFPLAKSLSKMRFSPMKGSDGLIPTVTIPDTRLNSSLTLCAYICVVAYKSVTD